MASKKLRQESEVNDWREGDEVNVGSHVDETEARVVDRVAGRLSHASSHRLNYVEYHQEGHVIVKRPLLRHHNCKTQKNSILGGQLNENLKK